MVGSAIENAKAEATHSDDSTDGITSTDSTDSTDGTDTNNPAEDDLAHKEGTDMARNVFDQDGKITGDATAGITISHDDMAAIVADAKKNGSLKDAVENYAISHGIDNIELLFPDAQLLENRPEFLKRQTEWVAKVLGGTRHSPFSRIKSVVADITLEDARAKGYVKGNLKREEFFGLTQRITTPTTIYKKQKLDRDDIVDITSFDVVAWLKFEMKMMLEEELARAILIGDGRDVAHLDKINEGNIRPIATEHELYATDRKSVV